MDVTTELSAVNSMLATIGEAPVNTIEDTSLVDVAVARAALSEVTRGVLVEGWSFNTDENFPLHADSTTGNINIPRTALVVLPCREFEHLTPRGPRLYDTHRFSYDFRGHKPVPCKIIWNLDFPDLPEVTRQFIAVRACRLFQQRTTASETLHAFTDADERQALWAHQKNNVRVRRKRFLLDSQSVRRIHLDR